MILQFLQLNESHTIFDLEEEDTTFKQIYYVESDELHFLEYDSRLPKKEFAKFYECVNCIGYLTVKLLLSWRVRARYVHTISKSPGK